MNSAGCTSDFSVARSEQCSSVCTSVCVCWLRALFAVTCVYDDVCVDIPSLCLRVAMHPSCDVIQSDRMQSPACLFPMMHLSINEMVWAQLTSRGGDVWSDRSLVKMQFLITDELRQISPISNCTRAQLIWDQVSAERLNGLHDDSCSLTVTLEEADVAGDTSSGNKDITHTHTLSLLSRTLM